MINFTKWRFFLQCQTQEKAQKRNFKRRGNTDNCSLFYSDYITQKKYISSHEFQWTLWTRSKRYLKERKIEKKRYVLGGGRPEWRKEFWRKIAKGNLERAKRNYRLFQVRGWWVRVKDDKGKKKCIKWINWAVFPIRWNSAHFSHRKEMNWMNQWR